MSERAAPYGRGAQPLTVILDGDGLLVPRWGVRIGERVVVTGGRHDDCGTEGVVRGVAFTDRWYVLVTRAGETDHEEPLYAEDVAPLDRVFWESCPVERGGRGMEDEG